MPIVSTSIFLLAILIIVVPMSAVLALPAVIIIVAFPKLLTVPKVARIITVFVIARGHPIAASIRRTSPVTGVPKVV
jgi:hypothetical protein